MLLFSIEKVGMIISYVRLGVRNVRCHILAYRSAIVIKHTVQWAFQHIWFLYSRRNDGIVGEAVSTFAAVHYMLYCCAFRSKRGSTNEALIADHQSRH